MCCPVSSDLSHRQAADLRWLIISGKGFVRCGRWFASESELFRCGPGRPLSSKALGLHCGGHVHWAAITFSAGAVLGGRAVVIAFI